MCGRRRRIRGRLSRRGLRPGQRQTASFRSGEQELFEGLVALLATRIPDLDGFLDEETPGRSRRNCTTPSTPPCVRVTARALRDRDGFLRRCREGLESLFIISDIQQSDGWAVRSGRRLHCLGGRGGLRDLLRRGRLNSAVIFFRWTASSSFFVAAGLLAGALRVFHRGRPLERLQNTVFDMSSFLFA